MGGQEAARQGASKDARALSCDIARRSINFFAWHAFGTKGGLNFRSQGRF